MATRAADLLTLTSQGLYCPAGDFHVDPMRPVDRALITHGHSDHARSGHGHVLATAETLAIMAVRYGEDFASGTQEAVLGEVMRIGRVQVTFVPAGHVLGSAQIVIEHGKCRLVVSGDYKRGRDPTCLPYEPVRCDVFITEATFGLPVFRHPDAGGEIDRLLTRLADNPERCVVVGAYALGKAQRVISEARHRGHTAPIYVHGALERLNTLYQEWGVDLGELRPATGASKAELAGHPQHAQATGFGRAVDSQHVVPPEVR